MSKVDAGVIVGRFQCDVLTPGHKALIERVAKNHELTIIVVGVPATPENKSNPLNFRVREAMIREFILEPDHFVIVPLTNVRDDLRWSQALDELVEQHIGLDGTATFYSGRDGFNQWYYGKHPVQVIDSGVECSATESREKIGNLSTGFTRDFRQGVIYAHQNRIHQTYETVDIALLKTFDAHDRDLQILIGRKPQEDKWRFPGGFVEPGERFVDAAARELKEETDLYCEGGFSIVDDFILDEWRIRGQKGVSHRTILCAGFHSWGRAIAGDDLEFVAWYPLAYVHEKRMDMLMPEHIKLLERLMVWIEQNCALDKSDKIG